MIRRDRRAFEAFSCEVLDAEPATPDLQNPDVRVRREGPREVRLRMPDGKSVAMWNFYDPRDKKTRESWPSKPIRVKQGQVVHSTLDAKKKSHTIHHHGMNASPFNDGVGHTSFETSGEYTYQFRPKQAGTYFYHCHKNTVLHFEMGMYGFLIVDPPEGRGWLYEDGPQYDVEQCWAIDDIDPVWRELNHQAGLCAEDAGLDLFRPKYFLINGVPHPWTMTDKRARIDAKVGQTILIRQLNATYSVVTTRIEGLDATIYAIDGRPLLHRDAPWSSPILLPAGAPLETVSAQRHDLILKPTRPGDYPVTIEFRDWISGRIHDNGRGVCQTVIKVT